MTIRAGETVFVDTNVLLSATDRSRPHHDEALGLTRAAGEAGCADPDPAWVAEWGTAVRRFPSYGLKLSIFSSLMTR